MYLFFSNFSVSVDQKTCSAPPPLPTHDRQMESKGAKDDDDFDAKHTSVNPPAPSEAKEGSVENVASLMTDYLYMEDDLSDAIGEPPPRANPYPPPLSHPPPPTRGFRGGQRE